MNRALRRVAIGCLVMFALLLVNVNYVQGVEAGSLASGPGNQRTFSEQYRYQRGDITTADGKVIAKSVPVKGAHKFQRRYPVPQVYAPVTGYDSMISATGVEKAENKLLSGTDPQLAVGNLIDLVTGKPKKGATVQLTINSAAQKAAYDALKAAGKPGAAVAIDPSTGAILAMASYPTFDPNKYATFSSAKLATVDQRYRSDPQQPLINRAVGALYPPGSTFKVVTSSALLASGKYTPQTSVYAPTNLKLPDTSKQLINYDNLPCGNGSGHVPLILGFAESCNTVFGNLGMKIGGAALRQQAAKFGMNKAGLRIPLAVSKSAFPPVSAPDLTAYAAIGQYSDTVTPLQEAMFSAAIADKGTLMTPYLVQRVTAPDLTPLRTASPAPLSQATSPQVAAQVTKMMIGVVQRPDGTAHHTADVPGLNIAAKTGTAQNGVGNSGPDDAVFTCFAPAGNPQIAVGVVVQGGGLGADASAPVAVSIVKSYLAYVKSHQGKS